jgi:hypothetical protein
MKENVKIFSVVIITVLVRDRDDNMRIHLYNPNRPAGKTNVTFINGIIFIYFYYFLFRRVIFYLRETIILPRWMQL